MIRHEVLPGDHIAHACGEAVAMATGRGEAVAFEFNGVLVTVQPGEPAADAAARWQAEVDRRQEAYRASPEGRAAAAEAAEESKRHQAETDALVARLPAAVGDLGKLVRWCVALSRPADHVGVRVDHDAIADVIEAEGYARNAHVGRPPGVFADRRVAGEYLVGQAVDCMRKGMPPHPVIGRLAAEAGFVGADD